MRLQVHNFVIAVGLYWAWLQMAPCNYVFSFGGGAFVVREGLVWAGFSALLFPLGFLAGTKFAEWGGVRLPSPFYASSMAVLAVSVGGSAAAMVAGL